MNRCVLTLAASMLGFPIGTLAQKDGIQTKTTYAKAYGETKNAVSVDPSQDLPRYPAVEPKDALSTWQVKNGFKLQMVASEPQVRSPIALCFDEHGRMFVCEMIDYSEMRDVTPHLGRISVLEDKDGDGHFETSHVFADNLPWPTGLVWANGGLYVGATPDIWRFEDKDADGKAEVREKVYTGFGTGLKILNVQGLMNSFQWGPDNRIHVLAGGGNRGIVTCLKRPDLKGVEIGGRDFWFDPLSHEFGLESGGAQYGMSFDNYGRKFGCSNSDHLQYWLYDDHYSGRNPHFSMPPAKQSIAADGGAAEVFRISPDEPWRIIRTRWRVAGVVKGSVEGGGRVSGYFTGATGTTIYRGDAYGPEFVNNSFTGDAGGQLVHRKLIRAAADGINLVGERPADEHGFEFAASKDTWVRVVNFANAPDGCLHICDMYREVIEHPWSIPDEIKKHLDLNSGNDRGRIYRIVPTGWQKFGPAERRGNLAQASISDLVEMLGHANGWHRDTAQRLLYERQDKSAVPLLEKLLHDGSPLSKLHALSALDGLKALSFEAVAQCMEDPDAHVRERSIRLLEAFAGTKEGDFTVCKLLKPRLWDSDARVRFQAALTVGGMPEAAEPFPSRYREMAEILAKDPGNEWLESAILSARPEAAMEILRAMAEMRASSSIGSSKAIAALTKAAASQAANKQTGYAAELVKLVAHGHPHPVVIAALAEGLQRAGTSLEKADVGGDLAALFSKAQQEAVNSNLSDAERRGAIDLLSVGSSAKTQDTLIQCLAKEQPDAVQSAAVQAIGKGTSQRSTASLLAAWPGYGPKAREAALEVLLLREDRTVALLESGMVKPQDYSASQLQTLLAHKSAKVAALARTALAAVIPPSRKEVTTKFLPAVEAEGDPVRGMNQFISRCMACHRAGTMGVQVGPDLITVKTKGRDALLTAILEPHKEVASQYIAYTVNTKDGQAITGIISEDTARSMTLRMMGGSEKTLSRAEIKGSASTGQSLMPEGLESGMSVGDMADLLSYIQSL